MTTTPGHLDAEVAACLRKLGGHASTLLHARSTLRPDAPSARHAAKRAASLVEALGSEALLLEGTLGEGGMGVVYLATQASLGRKVAVKQLRPEDRSAESTMRLLDEARVTGALEHPNILPIHDVRLGEEGQPQIVLKHIDGVSWSEVMHDDDIVRARFGAESSLDHNLQVLMQVCRAVHFAHSRGVVHRDLKPDNVMIGTHGEVYLLDWGVALRVSGDEPPPSDGDRREIAGTPAYMAPEMIAGGRVTERTDVYLLGATLYEVLSGNPPHVGKTAAQVAKSVLESRPRRPEYVAEELFALVRRAMAARPDDRYPSAEAFRLALQRYLDQRHAIRLAEEADRRLETLAALIDAADGTGRARAYELYGGCRFGFRQALEAWPSYELAERGMARSVQAMIELELGCGQPAAAATLLAELERPPEGLEARVAEAVAAEARERERIADLEQLGHDLDATPGMRARRLLVAVLGLAWTIAPAVTAWRVDPQREQYPSMLVAPTVALLALGSLVLWRRAELRRTAVNRRVVASILVGLVGQLAIAVGTLLTGADPMHARMHMLVLWGVVTAMAAATINRRLGWSSLGFFVAFGGCALFARSIADVLLAMAGAYLVVTVNVLAIWRGAPPPDGPASRAASSRGL